MTHLITPPLPESHHRHTRWGQLTPSATVLACNQLVAHSSQPLLVITPDIHTASQLRHDLHFFDSRTPHWAFPDRETLPFDHFSPHHDLLSKRLRTLSQIPLMKRGIIIAALPTLLHRLPPKSHIIGQTILFSQGDSLDIQPFRTQLITAGYRHVAQVMEHGEFLLRGALLDIFPMGSPLPLRIELFDDIIETLRTFDPDTQRTIEKIATVELLPANEYPLTEDAITLFRQQWRGQFPGNAMESPVYESISQGQPLSGIEYYLPLFFEKMASFVDYLPQQTTVVLYPNCEQAATHFWNEINDRYEQLRYDVTRPLCTPDQLFIGTDDFFSSIKETQKIQIQPFNNNASKAHVHFNCQSLPPLPVDHKAENPYSALSNFIETTATRVLIVAQSAGRREIIQEQLSNVSLHPTVFTDWQAFLNSSDPLGLTVASLERGFIASDSAFTLITETDLFGESIKQRQQHQQRVQDPNTLIRNLTELNIGSRVVHIDHGIGLYCGLERITTNDIEAEYLTLEYANHDRIYVPVSSLHLINRYTGSDADHHPLHKLGSPQWSKAKQKAAE